MQFLVNQKGKIEKKLSFEIKNIISRTALDLFTRDFLIHKSILMALFPQAFTLSIKATGIFSRFALHFEAMEQDILQQGFRSILPALGPALTQLSAALDMRDSDPTLAGKVWIT